MMDASCRRVICHRATERANVYAVYVVPDGGLARASNAVVTTARSRTAIKFALAGNYESDPISRNNNVQNAECDTSKRDWRVFRRRISSPHDESMLTFVKLASPKPPLKEPKNE